MTSWTPCSRGRLWKKKTIMANSPIAELIGRLTTELVQADTLIDMVATSGGSASGTIHYRRGLRLALKMAEQALRQEQRQQNGAA
jgi:hypothetical protein